MIFFLESGVCSAECGGRGGADVGETWEGLHSPEKYTKEETYG